MDSVSRLHHWARARQRVKIGPRTLTVLDTGVPALPLRSCERDAVLILSGVAVPWLDWVDVLSLLSPTQRVILVEREGMEGAGPISEGPIVSLPSSSEGTAASDDPAMSERPSTSEGIATPEGLSPSGLPSLFDEATALVGLLDAYQIRRVRILAHSMGAFIGEAFARLFPDRCELLVFADGSCANESDLPAQASPSPVVECPRAGVLERFTAYWTRYVWARSCVARLLWWPRRRGLATLPRGTERALALELFTDERFIRAIGREMSIYRLWADEVVTLARAFPLRSELRVLVATRHRVFQDPWVRQQRARFEARTAEIARHQHSSSRQIQNSFEVLSASHLLMRDNPELVASAVSRCHEAS